MISLRRWRLRLRSFHLLTGDLYFIDLCIHLSFYAGPIGISQFASVYVFTVLAREASLVEPKAFLNLQGKIGLYEMSRFSCAIVFSDSTSCHGLCPVLFLFHPTLYIYTR